jgi:apolipoprotein N-acyltransferase
MHGVLSLALVVLALPPLSIPVVGFLALVPWLFALRGGAAGAVLSSILFGGGAAVHACWGLASASPYQFAGIVAVFALAACLQGLMLARAWHRCGTALMALHGGVLMAACSVVINALGVPFSLTVLLGDGNPALAWAGIGGGYAVDGLLAAGQVAIVHALVRRPIRAGAGRAGVAAALYALIAATGPAVMALVPSESPEPRTVVLVQPRIPPPVLRFHSADGMLERIARHHRSMLERLSREPLPERALVVWPKSVVPGYAPTIESSLWRSIVAHDAPVLVHAHALSPEHGRISAVFGISSEEASATSRVDRRIAIPFAGSVPSPPRASGSRLHHLAGLQVGSLIGHESTVPSVARASVMNGAQLLVNPVDNAFLGPSIIAEIHAALARLRSLETGRPLVVVGNGGPSVVHDADGERVGKIPRFAEAVASVTVRSDIRETPYLRFAPWLEWSYCAGALAMAGGIGTRRTPGSVIRSAGLRMPGPWSGRLVGFTAIVLCAGVLVQAIEQQRRHARTLLRAAGPSLGQALSISYSGLRDRDDASAPSLALLLREFGEPVRVTSIPVAAAARRQPPRRALFYRKTRNLVLFVFGILITWAMLQLFGVFDGFTQAVTLEYIDFILRVGFAGFVIANAETLLDEADGSDVPGGGDDADSGTATVSTAD